MPYKIVETLEKGKRTLFYVPNDWEQNNILHWPKWKVESLLAIEDSHPDASWSTMKCRVKRTGLVSMASAEEELANMCTKSDTESEEPQNLKSQNVKRNNINIQDYFDEVSKTCTVVHEKTSMSPLPSETKTSTTVTHLSGSSQLNSSSSHTEKKKINNSTVAELPTSHTENNSAVSVEYEETPELQSTNNTESSVNHNRSYDEMNDINSMNITESQYTKVNESTVYVVNTPTQLEDHSTYNHAEQNDKIDNLIAISQTLSQNQVIILEYVKSIENKVLHKLSYISAQIDTVVTVNSRNQGKEENFYFQIISNKEELQTFEQNLAISEFRAETKLRLESVCGKGKYRGLNNAYTLADIMFTRQFMTQCSWAGGSKNNTNKICFKIYYKTIDLFFEVIHESDKDFTKKECEDFLKNIMRHAVSRNKPEIKRAPSCKRRRQKRVNDTQSANDKESDNAEESNENYNIQPTIRSTLNNESSYNTSVANVANVNVSVASVAPVGNVSTTSVAPVGNVSTTSVAPVVIGNVSGVSVAPVAIGMVSTDSVGRFATGNLSSASVAPVVSGNVSMANVGPVGNVSTTSVAPVGNVSTTSVAPVAIGNVSMASVDPVGYVSMDSVAPVAIGNVSGASVAPVAIDNVSMTSETHNT